MTANAPKKRVRLGELKKSSCCGPAPAGTKGDSSCCPPPKPAGRKEALAPVRVSSEWSTSDHIGRLRCRIGALRNDYRVEPGLYALGDPDKNSEVFISANYKLSFDVLRRELKGIDAWIVALDTDGINVWCAAGKGTFGTAELVGRIKKTRLGEVVGHRRIIVPQLGAPGVAAHEVKKETGFHVHYGPVEASDIPEYLSNGLKATKKMRTKEFPMLERVVLTPMEIRPAFKYFVLYAFIVIGASVFGPGGAGSGAIAARSLPLVALGALALFSGAFLTPALLPYIPARSFAIKGLITGAVTTIAALWLLGVGFEEPLMLGFALLFFPAASSYLALQFTGASTYTGFSGVKKELRRGIPVYALATIASIIFFAAFKLKEAGLL